MRDRIEVAWSIGTGRGKRSGSVTMQSVVTRDVEIVLSLSSRVAWRADEGWVA
jgi:hypothetical protein